jgi:hypothetical protein
LKPARCSTGQDGALAEWLYEAGIGECRAACVEDGVIIRAEIERETAGPRAGTILSAHLRANRIAEAVDGTEILLDRVPHGMAEGAALMITITREPLSEPGKPKRAKARVAPPGALAAIGASLYDRITASGVPVRSITPHDPDMLEAAGWSECLEAAHLGEVAFEGGALRISLTPAMTLIDIDGTTTPFALAQSGITAAGQAITRFGIAGSIGIDLPTLGSKAERNAVAAMLNDALAPPFEATAINGFGFMQIIRPRTRASLSEILCYDRVPAAARALLRRAQRAGIVGSVALAIPPRMEPVFSAHPRWLDQLGAQLGGTVRLRVDPALGIDAAYVEA